MWRDAILAARQPRTPLYRTEVSRHALGAHPARGHPSNHATHIRAFIKANIAPGATVITDGRASYSGLPEYRHDPRVVGTMAVHIPLRWINRVFALLKRWSLGTCHGLRRQHLGVYLGEFVFCYNRHFYRHVSFETVLGLAAHGSPLSYWEITGRQNPRKDATPTRRNPRRRHAPGWRRARQRGRSPATWDNGISLLKRSLGARYS